MHTLKIGILKDMYQQLAKYTYFEQVDIGTFDYTKGVFKGDDGYEMDDFKSTIKTGDRYNTGYDSAHFFKADFITPKSMDGKHLRARLAVGGESLVKCNGKFIAGCTSRDWMPDRKDAELPIGKAGEKLSFEIEATVDSMNFCDAAMDGAKFQECLFGDTLVMSVDDECEGYWYDLEVAFQALEFIKDDHISAKVYAAVDDSLHMIDFDFDDNQVRKSIYEARKFYNKKISEIQWSAQSKVMLTGHSHIDVAWLWRVQESIRKSARTFTNVCSLMDYYPNMTFGQSEAVLYEMTKKHYPEIFNRVKEKIHDGLWDVCGNVWVEADTNIASGESLIRQVLYGTEFFKKEFGKVSKTYWLPDCFGFTAALPQIIKGCGMENFITSKLTYNDTTKFPYAMFIWQGNNGDKVRAHLMRPSYNCNYNVEEIMCADNECNNKSELTTAMGMYGFGDGGGGPTRGMMERGKRLKNFPGLPKTEIGHIDDFFETYEEHKDELPVWNGEMYYENHRGTFTSQAFVKKNNRKGEYMLTRDEFLSVIAEKYADKEYDRDAIEKAWRILMTNQFHDILPGSSIHEVFEDCKITYAQMNNIGNKVGNDCLNALSNLVTADENTVTVWNLTSINNTSPVTVTNIDNDKFVKDIPSINKNGTLTFVAQIPPMSYKTFNLVSGKSEKEDLTDSYTLENNNLKVTIDKNGFISSIYDKLNNRESIDGKGNILSVSLDKCIHETAWNLELDYQKKMWILDKADSIECIENNQVRKIIRVKKSFNKSTITQDYILYSNDDSVIFDTTVDWHESDKVLKAGFDVAVIDTDATYDIAHGTYKRPTHWNTKYDLTRFEVAAHKWADLSEGGYGCSIINDCKYGYDIHNSHMRITLMRAPTCPDRTGDHGINTFKYAFHPHTNDWRNNTVEKSIAFNIPNIAVYNKNANKGILDCNKQFINISGNHVNIECLKKAQDNNGYILRVVEEKQQRDKCSVSLDFPFKKVIETNMIEEDKTELPVDNNSFSFDIKPFEVKTFRII